MCLGSIQVPGFSAHDPLEVGETSALVRGVSYSQHAGCYKSRVFLSQLKTVRGAVLPGYAEDLSCRSAVSSSFVACQNKERQTSLGYILPWLKKKKWHVRS